MRLNKFLALHVGISRREADELIGRGRVQIDGQTASLGMRTDDNLHARITLDGQKIDLKRQYTYIMLHKPAGYVCSRKRQGSTPTIYELLPSDLHALNSVGRLDKDSSGLLLLTNDGDFTQRMTHPSYHKQKIYKVRLDAPLEPLHQQMIADFGVQLDDGASKLGIEKLSENRREWRIIMHEGRNRQIRRTFSALGYTVTRLHRTDFGAYTLGELPRGEYMHVDKA